MRRTILFCLSFLFILNFSIPAFSAPMRVVYGFDREFPPFSYEAAGGEATGFEVEIIEALFKEADVTLVKRPLKWDLVPLELSSGTITITTGMVKNPQSERLFLFSKKPTFPLQIRLFTKVYKRYPSLSMFRGQAVSVEQGSFQHRLLENFGGINIKPYTNRAQALEVLYYDAVSAFCGPAPNTYYYINKLNYGAITSVGSPLAIVHLRIAINRNRGDVVRLVDEGLERIINNGEYNRIYRKWFVRELSPKEQEVLIKSAQQGAIPAYAPYTNKVEGAAVLTATGKVFAACNVENADQKLNSSALSNAVAKSISEGEFEIIAASLVDSAGQSLDPDNEDLQVLFESGQGILVVKAKDDKSFSSQMVLDLLSNPTFKEVTPETGR